MIENKKPELIEEDEVSDKDNKKFLLTGTIIIGSLILLIIACVVAIFILENV